MLIHAGRVLAPMDPRPSGSGLFERLTTPCRVSTRSSQHSYAAPLYRVPATQHDLNGLAINPMFLLQNARRQGVNRIVIQNRSYSLENNRTGIQILIDEMHRAPGKPHAVL